LADMMSGDPLERIEAAVDLVREIVWEIVWENLKLGPGDFIDGDLGAALVQIDEAVGELRDTQGAMPTLQDGQRL